MIDDWELLTKVFLPTQINSKNERGLSFYLGQPPLIFLLRVNLPGGPAANRSLSTRAGSPRRTHWRRSSTSARKWASSTKKILAPLRLRLCSQNHIFPHKSRSLFSVGLAQSFLGPLQDKPQPVQVVQASAAAERAMKTFLYKLPHSFPGPLCQIQPHPARGSPYRLLQCRLLRRVEGGGDHRFARTPVQSVPSGVILPASRQSYGHPAPGLRPLAQPTSPAP